MSRSKKQNPYIKICGSSNKKDKVIANKKFRRISRILTNKYPDKVPMSIREVSNTWSFRSDGLAYYLRCSKSPEREDIELTKRMMRK